jgi:hypothetical protein
MQELVALVGGNIRRGLLLRACGPRPMVWTTVPIAPAATSSLARAVARFSKRSE